MNTLLRFYLPVFFIFVVFLFKGCGSGLCPIGASYNTCIPSGGNPFVWASPQGVLDTAFNSTGIFSTDTIAGNDEAYGVTVQSDGRILVASSIFPAASTSVHLMRVSTAGILDTTFGTAGVVTSPAFGSNRIAPWPIQKSNGKIVVVSLGSGASSWGLAQFNSDGSLDTTFGTAGISSGATYRCSYGELDASERILAKCFDASDRHSIVRFDTQGSIDTTFGTTGVTVLTSMYGGYSGGIKRKTDGTILAAGATAAGGGNIIIGKMDANGILDTTFGTAAGYTTLNIGVNTNPFGINEQTDGKLVVGGTTAGGNFFSARFYSSGILDTTYGSTGGYTIHAGIAGLDGGNTAFRSLLIQPDNKIILPSNRSGFSVLSIARITESGIFDTAFNGTGFNEWNPGAAINVQGYAVHPDGRIVVTGGVLPAGVRRTYITLWK